MFEPVDDVEVSAYCKGGGVFCLEPCVAAWQGTDAVLAGVVDEGPAGGVRGNHPVVDEHEIHVAAAVDVLRRVEVDDGIRQGGIILLLLHGSIGGGGEEARIEVDDGIRQGVILLLLLLHGGSIGGGEEEARHVDAAQRVDALVTVARHQIHKPPETHLPPTNLKINLIRPLLRFQLWRLRPMQSPPAAASPLRVGTRIGNGWIIKKEEEITAIFRDKRLTSLNADLRPPCTEWLRTWRGALAVDGAKALGSSSAASTVGGGDGGCWIEL